MININKKNNCTGCHACYSICPKNCIEMKMDEEGFKYPTINKNLCINCNLCINVCPIINPINNSNKVFSAFALQAKDEKLLENSSSGGAFTLIAREILKKEGVIFGAAFDEKKNVIHKFITKEEDLNILQGSKYVQSIIGDSYKQVSEFLKKGKEVMFTGTPCQISGLKKYLGKEYNNLLCVDILCHGVPSPRVWEKYLQYREMIDGSKVKKISFRYKTLECKESCVKFTYPDKVYLKEKSKDLFMKGFLRNLYLRPSCYDCHFKQIDRNSDLTIGDFWSISNFSNDFNNKGVSMVLVQSKSGLGIIEKILKETNSLKILQINKLTNGGLYKSAFKNPERRRFFSKLDKYDFEKLYKKYFSDRLILKIRRSIARKMN